MSPPSKPLIDTPIVIIAGGQSKRLQLGPHKKKWQLPFGERSLLQQMITIATRVSGNVLINAAYEDSTLLEGYPYPVIYDEEASGPLSGILSALKWGKKNQYPAIITLPCDTPFVTPDWLKYVHDEFSCREELVIVSRHGERIHPLCAIWSTALCHELTQFMFNSEKKGVFYWAKQHAYCLDYKNPSPESNRQPDPFMNINTLDDYQRALNWQRSLTSSHHQL